MQELESRAEDMVLDAEQKIGTRDAEARSRQAPIWASISGHNDSFRNIFHLKSGFKSGLC